MKRQECLFDTSYILLFIKQFSFWLLTNILFNNITSLKKSSNTKSKIFLKSQSEIKLISKETLNNVLVTEFHFVLFMLEP